MNHTFTTRITMDIVCSLALHGAVRRVCVMEVMQQLQQQQQDACG